VKGVKRFRFWRKRSRSSGVIQAGLGQYDSRTDVDASRELKDQEARGGLMDDEMKALVQQYIEMRRNQKNDLMKELGLTEEQAEQAVSTLELYYHINASEDQWAQAWKAAKRDFLADGERTGVRLADLVVKYVDIARLGGGPQSRWT
jgi:hypothetical protein